MTNITSKPEQVVLCQLLAGTRNEHHVWDHSLGKKKEGKHKMLASFVAAVVVLIMQ